MWLKHECNGCTFWLIVLYLNCMCQCGLHAVPWSHIGILMRRLAAEPYSSKGIVFLLSVCLWNDVAALYSMVWDWRVSRAWLMLFYWPNLIYPSYTIFPFICFLSIGWYCGFVVFGLIGSRSVSLRLALPTSFNNNNNIVQIICIKYFLRSQAFHIKICFQKLNCVFKFIKSHEFFSC